MKFAINGFSLMLVLVASIVLSGLCGCATKKLPKAMGDSPNDQRIALAIQKGLADDSLFDYPDVEISVTGGNDRAIHQGCEDSCQQSDGKGVRRRFRRPRSI